MANTFDVRTYVKLEKAFIKRLIREWRKQAGPIYAAITQACHEHKWDEARRRVTELDMTEVGTQNREWIKYLLLSFANYGAGMVAKQQPSFVGVGSFDTLLNQVTANVLQYLEHSATKQVQMEALQLIAEDEQKAKTVQKFQAICTKCQGTEVCVDKGQDHPGVGVCVTCGSTYIDDVQKREGPFKHGSTQIDIPEDSSAGQALLKAREAISDEDVAGHGKETEAHVTVRFGLDDDDVDGLRTYISQLEPFTITLGKIEVFDVSEHSEGTRPVVVQVESPELQIIHTEISKHAEFMEKTFSVYKPHITLAYCKPEIAEKYKALYVMGSYLVTALTISHRSGVKETIPFGVVRKWEEAKHPRDKDGQWTPITGQPIIDALGPGYKIVGSVAKHGSSDHDLDILRYGTHEFRGGNVNSHVKHILDTLGFDYVGQSVLSPDDKKHSKKEYESGWSEVHHFEHRVTHAKVEVWSLLNEVKKADKAGRYVTPFVSFDQPGEDKLQLIASLNASRLATWGFTAEAEQRGVKQYKLWNVMDGRTSVFCRLVAHGRVFDVADARQKVNQVLQVQNPEDLKQTQPWPKQSRAAIDGYRKMSNEQLVERGLHIPPYHPLCRTVCILTGHPITKVLPPPASTSIAQNITLDTMKELGFQATQDDVDYWNAYVGQSPVDILSKLSGKTVQEVLSGALGTKAIQFTEDGDIAINARGVYEGIRYAVKTLMSPYTGEYGLAQADLITGGVVGEKAKRVLLQKTMSAMIDTGVNASVESLVVNVEGNVAEYVKLGFLPDASAWQEIRTTALNAITSGELKEMFSSLALADQQLIRFLLMDINEISMAVLMDLKVLYQGELIGKLLFQNALGDFALDLTHQDTVNQAYAYLGVGG